MALVVRCPSCRGASQVDPGARGLTVQCPLCTSTFVAVPEAELVAPGRPKPTTETPIPARPREELRPRLSSERKKSRALKEDDHDPHRPPGGGLPASVLVGLALLPFAIPILWLIAPLLLGHPPQLSFAVPLAIAISASILSLAVIYTIDWSPSLRVKGVFMLLGLAYFVSGSLYFLNKEMLVRAQASIVRKKWVVFKPDKPSSNYSVLMPEKPHSVNDQPIPGLELDCYKLSLSESDALGSYVFVVGNGVPSDKDSGSEKWFESTIDKIIVEAGGQRDPNLQKQFVNDRTGQQFIIPLPNNSTRIVRLFVIKGQVYYLSIEGDDLAPGDTTLLRFFESFHLVDGKK